jgi:diguanylate cyclase (GGDEF)-like protein
LLERYGAQFGDLVERRHAEAAMMAAKQNAESAATQTRQAMEETEKANRALRDEMDRRLKALADLEYLANHDPLTNLPNRNLFNERLKQVLDRARRSGEAVGLMFLDLDHFKDVNDTLGHDVGDDLLREVSHRLKACVRAQDTVARLGGDEFALIQVGLNYPADANVQAKRILHALTEPFHIGTHKVFTGASIGITVFPGDTDSAEQLQKNADLSMYLAKEEQRNTFRFYDSDLNAVVKRRAFVEQQLRTAIEQEQLVAYYQPKVAIASDRLVGAEALVRWLHPEHGMVRPDEFIPIAERTGLIGPLGETILRSSCEQFKIWHRNGHEHLMLAVNMSAAQFSIGNIPQMVRDILEETGFNPARLELELTETAIMNDMRNAVEVLNELHEIGISLSIDDFGTGYSSLSYLRQLPVNRIKIDRSFISEIDSADSAAAIARAVVNLGQSLGLEVVAEGVETTAQLDYLREIKCDEAQGYLFGRPMPASEFEAYLEKMTSEGRA